jgi:hypothetical protein
MLFVEPTEDALKLQQQLIALLGRGGFPLCKFCASLPSMLEAVPTDCREMEVPIEPDSNEGIKTLGLLWYPLSDQFLISKVTCVKKLQEPSYQQMYYFFIVVAIFVPLGLISPVVVYKLFLQQS